MDNIWQKRIFGLSLWALVSLAGFYVFFAYAYHLTLYLTSEGTASVSPHIYIDYGLKIILTIPVWWLLFKKLNHWKLWQKLLTHLLILPVWLYVWQFCYYYILESFDYGHLRGPAMWWDIYIPGLFYILQFGIFHMYDFYNRLQAQHRLEAELRELALKSELTALKAQLNPHFLYNIFNTISASVPPDQENTREMIAKLSDLFRYQLQGSKNDVVTLDEELNFVSKYLNLEKARFGDRLKFHFEIDDDVKLVPIPPMILQPIVENAIKHGISPKVDGGEVYIKAFKQNDKVHIEICDSGIGISPNGNNKEGIGLTNTKKRLYKMYQSTLTMSEQAEGGVRVQFDIPIAS